MNKFEINRILERRVNVPFDAISMKANASQDNGDNRRQMLFRWKTNIFVTRLELSKNIRKRPLIQTDSD